MPDTDRLLCLTPVAHLELLLPLLLDEARAGHFEPRMLLPEKTARMQENLRSIITCGRRTDEALGAQLLSWQQDGMPIGWLINSEILPGHGNELWLLLVCPEWRGRGEGHRMLAAAAATLGARTDLYARCYPASTAMEALFRRQGFQLIATETSGNKVFKRLRDGTALVPEALADRRLKAHVRLTDTPSPRGAGPTSP